jgi:hypothetical protein
MRALLRDPLRQAFIEVGCRRDGDSLDILLRDRIVSADELAARKGKFIAAGLAPNPLPGTTSEVYDSQPRPSVIGELYFGAGAHRSRPLGFVKAGGKAMMIHSLEIIGPGMHRLTLAREEAIRSDSYYRRSRWSRTIGALGREVWERLIHLKAGIVGCGRAGSLIADMLARLGFREIVLIDADMIEVHNLGEMTAVKDADVGANKAEALAGRLRSQMPEAMLKEISAPLGDDSAIEEAKRCDVLFATVDNDAARLTAAVTATLYHKTLIDIGTSVSYSSSGEAVERFMGADIRLIVPGDGCLLCRGNLVSYRQAVDDLTGYGLSSRRAGWRDQRAGSLRSLNGVAASIAVRMLEDLVAERIEGSLWAQLEFSERGRMSIHYVESGGERGVCSLCAKSGLGDDALAGLKP